MQDTPPEQKHMNAGTILPKEMCWGYENLRTGAICIERSLEGFVWTEASSPKSPVAAHEFWKNNNLSVVVVNDDCPAYE